MVPNEKPRLLALNCRNQHLQPCAFAEDVGTGFLPPFKEMSTLVRKLETGRARMVQKFHIEFELTPPNNSVLVETLGRRGKPIRILRSTIANKADVVCTHYCPQGNQPRNENEHARWSGENSF